MGKADKETDRIRGEAADWLVWELDGDSSEHESVAFRTWLDANAEHRRIYSEMRSIWNLAEDVSPVQMEAHPTANDNTPVETAVEMFPRLRLRAIIAIATGIAACIVIFANFNYPAPEPIRFSTDIAQVKEVSLEDGSIVTLAPRTRLSVVFEDDKRRATLDNGEAFFEIGEDRDRPFIVQTSTSSIKVVGTQFNVRDRVGRTQIGVVEGVVEIRSDDGSKKSRKLETLQRGQAAEIYLDKKKQVVVSLRAGNLGPIDSLSGSWKDGWLTYNDSPLADIIDDLNRYLEYPVVIRTNSLKDKRFTTSFHRSKIRTFIETLDRNEAINVEMNEHGQYFVY